MVKQKQKYTKNFVGELIFRIHTAEVILIVVLGLFVPGWLVVVAVFLVKLQHILLHDCVLTYWEAREQDIPKGTAYYQLAARRFFGIRLSRMGVHIVSAAHLILALAVAFVADYEHIRIRL